MGWLKPCARLAQQAMSAKDTEIVKRALDAFSRRDFEAFGELYTVDFEWFCNSRLLRAESRLAAH